MASVEFYFDYACPWSYLACVRLIETTTRTGTTIEWRPVVLDRILEQANPGQTVSREPDRPRKAAYEVLDIEAWSDYVGITINRPENWPADSELAALGGIAAARQDLASAYSDAVFSAYFGLGRDISEVPVLVELAGLAGLETGPFGKALKETALAESLDANMQALLAAGGFGTPTMFVDGQMFFGSDRMPLVEFALGQSSGREFIMPGQHG